MAYWYGLFETDGGADDEREPAAGGTDDNGESETPNAVVWSNLNYDVNAVTNQRTDDATLSNIKGTLDQCKDKCNSLSNCGGFSRDTRPDQNQCWLKFTDIDDGFQKVGETAHDVHYDLYIQE